MAATVLLAVVMCSASNANVQQPVTIKIVNNQTGLDSIVLGNTTDAMPPEGYPFTVKVVLQGTVTNLSTYQIAVKYNATALNCTGIWINSSDPTFIFRQYRTEPIIPPAQPPCIEGGFGYVLLGASLLFNKVTVTDGLLCQINFTTKAQGTSLIEVVPTGGQPFDTFLSTAYVPDILFDIGPHFSVTVATKTPPVASFFIFTQNPEVNQRVYFNAYDSYDPDGVIISYFWDYGDGNTENLTGITANHTYTIGGRHIVNLTVTDNDGLSDSSARELLIGTPPIGSFAFSPTEIQPLEEVLFNASESYDFDGEILCYFWDFGDDSNLTSASPEAYHIFTSNGVYRVKLTVTDNDDLCGSACEDVLVGTLPTPNINYLRYCTVGETVSFDASLSRDSDGNIARAVWDFGDSNVTTINVTNPPDLRIKHRYDVPTGIFTLNLTVFDNDGLYSSLQFEIEVTAPAETNLFIVILDHNEYQGTITANSELSDFVFDPASKEIRFLLSGETGTEGNCEITIPKSLLEGGPWGVRINGEDYYFVHSQNQTHAIISFSYVHQSVLNVAVKGTWAIPEYPTNSIALFLALMSALLLTYFLKRRPKSRTEFRRQETTD